MVFISNHLHHVIYILLLTTGAFLILNKVIFRFSDKSLMGVVSAFLLLIITLFSIWGYTRFGNFHEYGQYGKHTYHYSEIYQYSMGAKYFKELGYFKLYDFTYVALRELRKEGTRIPQIDNIRSLKNVDTASPAEKVYQTQKYEYLSNFSQTRWNEFKNDLKTFLDFGWEDQWWKGMLFDLGFNPPPTWITFGAGWVANLFPFSQTTMEIFPLIDMFFLFILAGYFIFRSFGFYPLCGYLIIIGTNGIASYAWTGGSYFRHDWVCSLILAICFLKEEKYILSGIFFGLSTALRIFPAFFFAGAIWSLLHKVYKDRSFANNLINFILSGLTTTLILFSLSIFLFGFNYWHDFFEKIINHNNQLWVNHITFKKYFVFSKDIGNQNFWFVPGLQNFAVWQVNLNQIIQSKIILFESMRFLMLLSSLIIAFSIPPFVASFVVGGTILFLFSIPANYYYVYLAILPVLFFSLSGKWAHSLRMILSFVLMLSILLTPLISQDSIIGNGYINTLIFYFFITMYLSFLIEIFFDKNPSYKELLLNYLSERLESIIKTPKYLFFIPFLFFPLFIIYNKLKETNTITSSYNQVSWNNQSTPVLNPPALINLSLQNVLYSSGGTVTLQNDLDAYGPYWKNNDQIFFLNTKPGSKIGFMLNLAQGLKGELALNVTTANDYGIIQLLLNNKTLQNEPIDLYSQNISYKRLKFENVSFKGGENILSIKIIGKNANSTDTKLGIDTIEIKKMLTHAL